MITSTPDVGSIIKFNGIESNMLRIPLTVWDENTTEELKVHYLLESASLTPVASRSMVDFPCPEVPIPGTGSVMRTEFALNIESGKIPRNACTRLSVAVSANFGPCDKFPRPEDWSKTIVPGDDTNHRALAVYWIWEVSADPSVNADAAQRILSSCPTPPSSDTTPARSN